LNEVRIRAATLADAAAIAQVHVRAWHETYRGLVPEEMLAALSVELNTHMWTDILARGAEATTVIVAEHADEHAGEHLVAIVGFGSAGPARDEKLGTEGEVSAIYLLDAVKRRGIGRALFAGLLRALAARGHRSAGLWVLVSNDAARRFYETVGGRPGATRVIEHTGAVLHEVAYVWGDLAAFEQS
jgi:ribosomal protein S18 acetylase RimI-like enzyme